MVLYHSPESQVSPPDIIHYSPKGCFFKIFAQCYKSNIYSLGLKILTIIFSKIFIFLTIIGTRGQDQCRPKRYDLNNLSKGQPYNVKVSYVMLHIKYLRTRTYDF